MEPAKKKGKPKPGAKPKRVIELPVPVPTIVPRFALNDPQATQYLDDNGYVVYKGIANAAEIEKGKVLAWDFIEKVAPGVSRADPTTWDHPSWPDPFGKGIVSGDAVGQSEFLWFCRGIPNVKSVFAQIWGTQDLITSFDGFCIWRPIEYNMNWKSADSWYHLDQNANTRPDKAGVQGFLNFYPAGVDDGGLVVVPKSHLYFKQIYQKYYPTLVGDFCIIARSPNFWKTEYVQWKLSAIKICCEPGDFVCWDSRTIHCSSPSLTKRAMPKAGNLPPRRLVAYVCMTPKSRMTEEVGYSRINAYLKGETTSHWPEDCNTPAKRKNTKTGAYQPIALTKEQKILIPYQTEQDQKEPPAEQDQKEPPADPSK